MPPAPPITAGRIAAGRGVYTPAVPSPSMQRYRTSPSTTPAPTEVQASDLQANHQTVGNLLSASW